MPGHFLASPHAQSLHVKLCDIGICYHLRHAMQRRVQATSVVVRPAMTIPAQMLFTEYRDEKGEAIVLLLLLCFGRQKSWALRPNGCSRACAA